MTHPVMMFAIGLSRIYFCKTTIAIEYMYNKQGSWCYILADYTVAVNFIVNLSRGALLIDDY